MIVNKYQLYYNYFTVYVCVLEGRILRICICDDDTFIVEQLVDYLYEYFEKHFTKNLEIALFDRGKAILENTGKKDIVFLDVEMPELNGICVGRELKKENKDTIIFIVTSYSEYLDDAMRFHVFRYLSKPIDKERLFRNMTDAMQLYRNTTAVFPVETRDGIYSVRTNQIICIETLNRKTIVHTADRDYESMRNMQYWVKNLPESSFFQTHRSFIVNLNYVEDFDHNMVRLYHGSFVAYITRRKYAEFKKIYMLFLASMR